MYNAADALGKIGGDGFELDRRWSKLSRNADLLKFGGGFYVGKVGDIFVINGFYAAMRAAYAHPRAPARTHARSLAPRWLSSRPSSPLRLATVPVHRGSSYTTPPAQLHYFTVQWPTASLSWSAFRASVLGATNPAEAEKGSVRRDILEQWEALGLSSQPNVGENGVHASASPFEALAERMNWTGVALDDDLFGRGMLAAGVAPETIMAWTEDPQVELDGKKGSLFDLLEDRDADDVLATVPKIRTP